MYGIIYKATGPTGLVYIGQTTESLKERKRRHQYRAHKKDRRGAFQIAILEHGGANAFQWDQIDTADTQEELDEKEKQYIAIYKSDDPAFGYNSTNGGRSFTPSPEARKKMSEANKRNGNKPPSWTGKKHTPETRKKMSLVQKGVMARYGKPHSEEHRRAISKALKGRQPWNKGKKATPEHCRAISEGLKKFNEKKGGEK